MNHTPNYQLSQWAASDRIQRADFNADNAKIDAAIAAARKAPCCVHGTYVGNGETVTVNIGFRPSFLMVLAEYRGTSTSANIQAILGGAARMLAITMNVSIGFYTKCQITDTGFTITDTAETGMTTKDIPFQYYAFY